MVPKAKVRPVQKGLPTRSLSEGQVLELSVVSEGGRAMGTIPSWSHRDRWCVLRDHVPRDEFGDTSSLAGAGKNYGRRSALASSLCEAGLSSTAGPRPCCPALQKIETTRCVQDQREVGRLVKTRAGATTPTSERESTFRESSSSSGCRFGLVEGFRALAAR
eukprot:5649838-Amphidinium_carterae.3